MEPLVLDPPPVAGADPLGAHLGAVGDAAGPALSEARGVAEREAADPLRALVREAAAAHAEAAHRYGLDRPLEAPARDPDDLWGAFTDYRAATAAALDALRVELRALDLGQTVGAAYDGAADALATLAEDAPEAVRRAEPDDLLAPEPGDPLGLRAEKWRERSRRALRRAGAAPGRTLRRAAGRPAPEPAPPEQTVPLRALLEAHLTERLPRVLADDHRAAQTALGRHVAALEQAWEVWTDEILRLEAELDRPRFHLPEDADAPAWRQNAEAPEAASDGATPDEAAAGEAHDARVRRARAAAAALTEALGAAQAFELPEPDADALPLADADLRERVRRAGFDAPPTAPTDAATDLLSRDAARWRAWHRQVGNRLGLSGLLLALRERLTAEVEGFIERVTAEALAPVREAAAAAETAFAALRAEAEAAFAAHPPGQAGALVGAVRPLLARALAVAEGELLPALRAVSLHDAAQGATTAARERLGAFVAAQPETLTFRARLDPARAGEAGQSVEVPLRRILGELVSEGFTARVARVAEPLGPPLLQAATDAAALADAVRYNLETALDELERAAAPPDAAPSSPDDAPTPAEDAGPEAAHRNARELTLDGLGRAAERVHALAQPLGEPWRAFVRATVRAFGRAWSEAHERLTAGSLAERQLADLKAQVRRRAGEAGRVVGEGARRGSARGRALLRLARLRARRLVRQGRAAAGLAEQTTADRQRTLDALAEAELLRAGLPVVYRRLFAFAPVADPQLLVGRDAALEKAASQHARWQGGRATSALVVAAMPGAGRTSFAQTLRATAFDQAATLALAGRFADPHAFGRAVAEALGIEGDAAGSLDALEAHLLGRPPEARRACVVENLEHLLLRAPGGLDLVERVLIFFSRTDPAVFWLGTVSLPAWRFVERTAPQVTGLVDALVLGPLSRRETEALVMRRHQRSGLALRFAPPEAPSPLLARKLGRAKPDEQQTILRGEFFDGLFRASGAHPALALLYWLRSIEAPVAPGGGAPDALAEALTLRPVRPLDFGFLAGFDLPRAFALKALLQHGTLTLDEHDRIFRTPRAQSFLVFESLRNLRLIEPDLGGEPERAAAAEGAAPSAAVEAGVPYRLHPLVVAPVTEALRARNML